MRIISGQFNDSFAPVVDGVANVVRNYAYWLDKKYGKSYVATPAYPGYIDREPFPVLRYYSLPLKKREPYRLGFEILDINFRRTIKKIPFDIVHAHCPFTSGWIALQTAKKKNIPIIATFHSKFYEDFKQVLKVEAFAKICVRMVIEFFNKVDQVWTVSKGALETLREYGYKGEIEIVPNGTDFSIPDDIHSLIKKTKDSLDIKENQLMFLFVGQHIWQKNLKFLMEALKIVHQKGLKFRMVFAGEGYAREELQELSKVLGLEKKVTFLGRVLDRDFIKSLFARADLFLFPSLYDTSGIVIQEAAAVATPSLVINNCSVSENIKDGINGYTSEHNPESYAQKIMEVTKDRNLLKEVGIEAQKTLFRSWETVIDEVYDRYVDIINIYKKANKIS